ncbi:MFS transporter [Zhihengliuella salsuginis]|uniref:MFS transporter n=1 Tax=Zhihengliuella salsuginis TaxID=578222 RepID=A0ABQ3GJ87_9MICC|nr:MFS transporter [Zhihengliuella salsuginis]GHD10273.1 MFS transporter [Zhihengliuella salsuginis]
MGGTGDFRLRDLGLKVYGPSLLYAVGLGAITPVIALSALDAGASVPLSALVVTLVGVGSLLMNVPAALLTARFGERSSMIAAAGVAAVGMGAAIASPNLGVLAGAVLLVGMAGSVFNLARQSYLAEAVPAYFRARAMSTLGGTLRIGAFVGPFLSAAVMVPLGLAGAYWVGLAAMAGAAVVGFWVPDLPAPGGSGAGTTTAALAGPGAAEDARRSVSMRRIARENVRTYATVGIGVFVLAAVRATRNVVLPLWSDQLGLDPAMAAIVYGVSGAVDVIVFYPAGKIMDRYGRIFSAVPCLLLLGVSLALLPLVDDLWALLWVGALMGFGNGLGTGIVMTLGADYAPAHARPQFLGIWRLLTDSGMMAGPVVLSAVTSAATLGAGILVIAAAAFVGTGVFAYYLPRSRD